MLGHPILRPLTLVSSTWFIVFQGWMALQTLYATRELGLSPGELGAAHMVGGAGALLSSVLASRVTRRLGTGVPILIGVGCSALSWLLLALMPRTDHAFATLGAAMFVFDFGVMLYWISYASLRQAVTPTIRAVAGLRCTGAGAVRAGRAGPRPPCARPRASARAMRWSWRSRPARSRPRWRRRPASAAFRRAGARLRRRSSHRPFPPSRGRRT